MASNELRQLLATPPQPSEGQPATALPTDPRQIAFLALQRLRESGDPSFLFLRTLIELASSGPAGVSGANEELAFHCAGGTRHVLLHRWATYTKEFRDATRDWLASLGMGISAQHPGADLRLPRTVANACLGCSASLWKRGWKTVALTIGRMHRASADEAEGAGAGTRAENAEAQAHLIQMMQAHTAYVPHRMADRDELFQLVESLVNRPFASGSAAAASVVDLAVAAQASSFLRTILGEVSGTSMGGGYNQPLEFHRNVHSTFESIDNGLDATLKMAMSGLGGIVRTLTDASSARQDVPAQVIEVCSNVVVLTVDALSWDFGSSSTRSIFILGGGKGGSGATGGGSIIIRPPERWRDYLIRPDFLGAVFAVYTAVRTQPYGQTFELVHRIRQLLLMLSSVSGSIYETSDQRQAYASFLVDGCLNVLGLLHQESTGQIAGYDEELAEGETVDLCAMVTALIANFKVENLSKLPSFGNLLGAVTAIGNDLLQKGLVECERAKGDVADMDGTEWRNEALGHLLDASVLLADDPWLLGGGGDAALAAEAALASSLSPLYGSYVTVRTKMARLEEYFASNNADDLDEVREEISEIATEEEMTSASSLGRLNVATSATSLTALLQECLPKLQSFYEAPADQVMKAGEISPDAAALLEEARLLIVCITHLLTDDNAGEMPMIPEAIIKACRPGGSGVATIGSIAGMVSSLMKLAEYQVSLVAANASDPRLSPLMAKTQLWLLNRWAPAYILTPSLEYDRTSGGILGTWSSQEAATSAVNFCVTLCLHYHCYWPQENQVQEAATELMISLSKRGKSIRDLILHSTSFQTLAAIHSATTSLRHSSSAAEVHATLANANAAGQTLEEKMIKGYIRLPYSDQAKILTSLLVASSEIGDEKAKAIFETCLVSVQNSFSSLAQALSSKQIQAQDVNAVEMTSLCVELYGGMARSSSISEPARIPHFITPSLRPLSELMKYYAEDLTICESLLRFFRDYSEQFISVLNGEQCLTLFHASSELLKSYSSHHVAHRVVVKASSLEAELIEEQSYSDIICAISLLMNLGTKDFIDICSTTTANRIDSSQVTDIIFFGLKQILPLMTDGLLQFPSLCTSYFSLVGFMMDTFPDRVCALPFDLFNPLFESMLFGMSHSDSFVAKSSLRGLGELAREHLKSKALTNILTQHPGIVDKCASKLLNDVVFNMIIWDRLEPAGMALLPVAAVDLNRFSAVVTVISAQFGSAEKAQRFQTAFQTLMQPGIISKVASGGYEGRMNRIKFKALFEDFVREIHSFLVVK